MTWSTKRIVLVAVASIVILGCALVASFYFLTVGLVKGSQPYRMTIDYLRTNPVLAEETGPLTSFGFFPMGNVRLENGGGDARIRLSVKGSKGKGRVVSSFYRQEGKWSLTEATFYSSQYPDGLPLSPLEVTAVTFHSDSDTGPVNGEKLYDVSETIYWTVVVERAAKREGSVYLKEGLKVMDSHNQIIAENPDLVIFHEKTDGASVSFNNNLVVPEAGDYRLVTTVTDQNTNRQTVHEESVHVVYSKTLQVKNLIFHDQSAEGIANEKGVYRMGDSVYVTFDVVGFSIKEQRTSLSEDLFVLDTAGDAVLEKPAILTIEEDWEKGDKVTLQNKIDIPMQGSFRLKIVLHDKNAGKEYESLHSFTIQ